MASVIKIKRTGSTDGAPGSLKSGELAYNYKNGFNRLYYGKGDDNGNATSIVEIGGEFYTTLLSTTAGTVVANQAVIVDSNKKVNEWLVGNITITGSTNTIASTNTNGDINITPAGSGKIVLDGQSWPNALGSADTYLKTDASGVLSWAAIPSGTFTIAGDTGTDTFSTGGTLTFEGTNPVQTAVTDDKVTISVDDATTSAKGIASFSSDNFAVTSGAVTIKDGGVSNAELVNSSITINSTAVSLGGSITGLAVTSGKLDQFAATSSLELAGVISDETGSGSLVFATSPTLVTPVLGAATATSITGSASTLTLAAAAGNNNVILSPTGSGTVDVSSKRITSVADPVGAQDAATKAYVDAVKTGLDVKDSVRVGTTAELNVTYDNGAGTLTNAGTQAAITIDSIPLSLGQRVLVKDQTTNPFQNGIYTVTTVGTVSTNWVLTRATDFDSAAEVTGGAFTFVEEGTVNADNGYVLTTNGTVTLGTTNLTFVQFSGAGQITAGDALTKTGNTLDVAVDDSTIEISGDALRLKDAGTTFAKIQNVDGLSVVGRNTNTAGTADEITAGTDHQVLRRSGNVIGFGAIALNQADATSGQLPVAKGGTGASTFTLNGILYGNGTDAVQVTAASTVDGSFLTANNGAAPSWTNTIDGGTY